MDSSPAEYISFIVYAFLCSCIVFAIIAAIHCYVYWQADCFRIAGIRRFILYTWDFYSDVALDLELLKYSNTQFLFWICTVFIVIPWISNIIILWKSQKEWIRDVALGERVYEWFGSWQILIYSLAGISGSAFGAVELTNCYAFGIDCFCMGLNERHLHKYSTKRLWSVIIAQDLPQLIIQFVFLSVRDWNVENLWIVVMAMISTILSSQCICYGIFDIYSSNKLLYALEDQHMDNPPVTCSMCVLSNEIKENAKRLQISTYAFRDVIAETLTTHPRSIEIHFPIAIPNGFKMKFTVFSSKLKPMLIYERLMKDHSHEAELQKKIKKVWRLQLPVQIPTDTIKVGNIDNGTVEVSLENSDNHSAPVHAQENQNIEKNDTTNNDTELNEKQPTVVNESSQTGQTADI